MLLKACGGVSSASCPGHFTCMEKAPGTHWIGDRVDPSASPDTSELNYDSSIIQPVAYTK